MKLTGQQAKRVQQVLLDAFPTRPSLEQMLKHELDANLAEIVEGGNLQDIIFQVIRWAEAHGRLPELVKGARRENPGNQALQELCDRVLLAYQNKQPRGRKDAITTPAKSSSQSSLSTRRYENFESSQDGQIDWYNASKIQYKDGIQKYSVSYGHPLFVAPEALQYFHQFLSNNFGNIKYTAYCQDKIESPFNSFEDLLAYENPAHRAISGLQIKAYSQAKEAYIEIHLQKSQGLLLSSTTKVDFYYVDPTWGMPVERELDGRIKELRPWYSWIRKIKFSELWALFVFLSLGLLGVVIFLKMVGIPSSEPSSTDSSLTGNELTFLWMILLWIIIFIGISLDRVKNYFFPHVFFSLGKQAIAFKRRQTIMYIIGGICVSIFVGLIINQFL